MNKVRQTFAMITMAAFLASTHIVVAQDTPIAARYAGEQAQVLRLSATNSAEAQSRLAEILRDGLMIGPANPLRRPDRSGAVAAYRRALSLGDRSAGTIVTLARLLLREGDAAGLGDLRPALRSLVIGGNGEAAYVLALDAARMQPLSRDEMAAKLEAAAVMGSISAVTDLIASGKQVGSMATAASLNNLQNRAASGSAQAAYGLYQAYQEGRFARQDPVLAMRWLQRAVDLGHIIAMEKMADALLHGSLPDPLAAASLYRAAANGGSARAAIALAHDLEAGNAMHVTAQEARQWLRCAAEAGYRGAAASLVNLEIGLVLSSDLAMAEKAAAIDRALLPIAGDPDALANLADRHWKTASSDLIGTALMPLLREQALKGSPTAGLAYDAWLQLRGEKMPIDIARALVNSLQNRAGVKPEQGSPDRQGGNPSTAAMSNFIIAGLALNDRIPEQLLPRKAALNLLFAAAAEKVGPAMARLGELYRIGEKLAQSRLFASHWLTRAADQGVESAGWDLAALQLASDDEKDRAAAERFYRDRLDAGDLRAGLALLGDRLKAGNLDLPMFIQVKQAAREPAEKVDLAALLIGSGTQDGIRVGNEVLDTITEDALDPDALVAFGRLKMLIAATDDEARHGMQLLVKAASTGAAGAKIALAATYLSSVTYRDDQGKALQLLEEVLAESPYDPDARLLMAKAYLMGLGTKRDIGKASELMNAIRAEGEFRNSRSTLLAADWLAFSASGRNPQIAVSLLKGQAGRGSVSADGALGRTYLSGFGPTLEPDAAAGHLLRAATAGDKDAMASLGHLLVNGYGVSRSRDLGLDWLKRSAEAGNTEAMYDLSRIFVLDAARMPQDATAKEAAAYWLQRAAERNHANATYQLGLAYLTGDQRPADSTQAAVWLERSASAGNLLAGRKLDALRRQVSDTGGPDPAAVSNE